MGTKQKLFSVTIKDCKVDTFTVGGNGGAGKDTSNTGVRCSHAPSGSVGISVDSRSQLKNKQMAFRRMAESKEFQTWARLKAAAMGGRPTINEWVESQMKPENLKIEYRCKDGWSIGPEGV